VIFNTIPSSHNELVIYRDWFSTDGKNLLKEPSYTYKDVEFSDISRASRTKKERYSLYTPVNVLKNLDVFSKKHTNTIDNDFYLD
jgi:hypothetical protein